MVLRQLELGPQAEGRCQRGVQLEGLLQVRPGALVRAAVEPDPRPLEQPHGRRFQLEGRVEGSLRVVQLAQQDQVPRSGQPLGRGRVAQGLQGQGWRRKTGRTRAAKADE